MNSIKHFFEKKYIYLVSHRYDDYSCISDFANAFEDKKKAILFLKEEMKNVINGIVKERECSIDDIEIIEFTKDEEYSIEYDSIYCSFCIDRIPLNQNILEQIN